MTQEFDTVSLATLHAADNETLDALPFGVIGFAPDSLVTHYNKFESAGAGLRAANVLGRHLFYEVAPCMNNFMVAQRFEDEPELDATLPYVLTLRMRPTPVRLRLLRGPQGATRFLLIEREPAQ
ncbi:phosphonate transporter [Paraburkholderia sp. BCC1884]|uniref:phosphonate transporter n=1 Tax=Paraburkholderia sp. BCC1884 TaxID=2562668 RepID=UPI001C926D30|nr:phosphonate transporter [Paraburkholderia sp. BCC1884]